MVYVEFGEVENGWALVTLQHFQPQKLTQGQTTKGLYVEEIPPMTLPQEKFKSPQLFIKPTTKQLEWRNVDRPLTEIEQLSEKLRKEQEKSKTANQRYQEMAKEAASLEHLKSAKTDQLNEACESAIIGGFTSATTGHFYAFGAQDQTNFTQQMLLLIADPGAVEVAWKTEDEGVIVHTREQFLAICAEAEQHKRAHIARYWQLKEDVAAATTWQQVDAIAWS